MDKESWEEFKNTARVIEGWVNECRHHNQHDTSDFDTWPPEDPVWVCDDCGKETK